MRTPRPSRLARTSTGQLRSSRGPVPQQQPSTSHKYVADKQRSCQCMRLPVLTCSMRWMLCIAHGTGRPLTLLRSCSAAAVKAARTAC